MTHTYSPVPVSELKDQAKRLRVKLREDGTELTHSEALETVAHQHGARDWNTLIARSNRNAPKPLQVGDRVQGRYLNQPFAAVVKGVNQLSEDRHRISLHFDNPVDVVTFDSFSSFRQRVSAVVGTNGCSVEKTSDGLPQMVVNIVR